MSETYRSVPAAALPGAANISRLQTEVSGDRTAEVRTLDPVPGLVGRAKEGDKDAFGQLYRLYHAPITRVARARLGEGADDVVGEVFLRAWAALPRYRDTGAPFAAWLHGIARNVIADEHRRRGRTQPTDELPDTGIELRQDDRLILMDALARLPDEQRQVIELKFLLGMRNPEVAAAMGTTTGAVNAKQWRALAALRGLMGEPS